MTTTGGKGSEVLGIKMQKTSVRPEASEGEVLPSQRWFPADAAGEQLQRPQAAVTLNCPIKRKSFTLPSN